MHALSFSHKFQHLQLILHVVMDVNSKVLYMNCICGHLFLELYLEECHHSHFSWTLPFVTSNQLHLPFCFVFMHIKNQLFLSFNIVNQLKIFKRCEILCIYIQALLFVQVFALIFSIFELTTKPSQKWYGISCPFIGKRCGQNSLSQSLVVLNASS